MSKQFAAPIILSIFAVSCGGQTQSGNNLQARGSANTPITIAAPVPAQSSIQTGSLMKCLTVSGWELEVIAKNSKTLVLNFKYEGDSMVGSLQATQSIELARSKMHDDLGTASRTAYGISKVTKVTSVKGPMHRQGSERAVSVADFLKSVSLEQIELSATVEQQEVTEAKAMIVGKLSDGGRSTIQMDALTCADRPESFLEMKIAK
jgi:hypothetical protein